MARLVIILSFSLVALAGAAQQPARPAESEAPLRSGIVEEKPTEREAPLRSGIVEGKATEREAPLRFLITEYDYGEVRKTVTGARAVFPCVNEADTAVSIVGGAATCGCSIPEYPRTPIAPGDTAYVRVYFDASGQPSGPISKKVTMTLSTGHRLPLHLRALIP